MTDLDAATRPADAAPAASAGDEQRTMHEIERRVLWLSTAIIDHANRVRPNHDGLKVGGHQASCASMVSIMTALWFGHLRPQDRVSVKPHASPVLHAINFLLGELEADRLTGLREFGGLQSYPSRAKDPDPVDYSTGSVGIGATAPIWGALAGRYAGAAQGRQYSLVGDAELDEGAVWEAVLDPAVAELGEVVWIVDLNRQSLDRVVPNLAAARIADMFAAAGWQVLTVKYGATLEQLFRRPGGAALRARLDAMSNPEYQRLLRCDAPEQRTRLAGDDVALQHLLETLGDDALRAAVGNLGGHDLDALDAAFDAIDDTRPTVVLAYTVKGFGLPTQGHPQNHSSLVSAEQLSLLAEQLGADAADPWAAFAPDSAAARRCRRTADALRREPLAATAPPPVPNDIGRTPTGTATTQSALGRVLLDVSRAAPEAARRIVTVSPDVSTSTNLGGWVNKVGVWSARERVDWFADDSESILHWRETPEGQHIELGIAETNLVGLIGELGATWSRWAKPLLPIGVLYDPFVERALEPWSFGIYAGGQSVLVGTPSGVTLASEGGAHQSVTTPSIGLEQPGCVGYEPAFAIDVEWTLLAALAALGRSDGHSSYLRLSTRPVDQQLAAVPDHTGLRERRRRQVVAGGYLLRTADTASNNTAPNNTARDVTAPDVTIVAMGALVPEALSAADELAAAGIAADVVCVTSPGLLFAATRARTGQQDGSGWILTQVLPERRAAPMVTVLDGHPHTLAFLAGVHRVPHVSLGVTRFGQSGSLQDVYRYHEIDAASIVRAAADVRARG